MKQPKRYIESAEKDFIEPYAELIKKSKSLRLENYLDKEQDIRDYSDFKLNLYTDIKNTYEHYMLNFFSDKDIRYINYHEDEKGIEKLSEKYFYNLKPFGKGKKEKDFTDVVISQELIYLANHNNEVDLIIFVSDNYTDFTDYSKDQIETQEIRLFDLSDDIVEELNNSEKVKFVRSISDLLKYFQDLYDREDELEILYQRILDFLETKISDIFEENNIYYEIENELEDFLSEYTVDGEYIMDGWYKDIGVSSLKELTEIDIIDLQSKENGIYSIYGEISGKVDFSYGVEYINPLYERGDKSNTEFVSEYGFEKSIYIKKTFVTEIKENHFGDEISYEVIQFDVGDSEFWLQ